MEASPQSSDIDIVKELSIPLYQSKGWMKFLGVLSIIYGVLTALSIVGIIVAWLPIWLGVLLFQAANAIDEAQQRGDRAAMVRSLGKIKIYFIVLGILTLIGLILTVLGFFMGMFGAIMGAGMQP